MIREGTAEEEVSTVSPQTPEPAELHLKAQCQEMSINLLVHELEVCTVLDSGAWKTVLPLIHYIAIHPEVQLPHKSSIVEKLLNVGKGKYL